MAFWIVPSLEGPRNRSSDLPEKSSGTAIASSLPIEPQSVKEGSSECGPCDYGKCGFQY